MNNGYYQIFETGESLWLGFFMNQKIFFLNVRRKSSTSKFIEVLSNRINIVQVQTPPGFTPSMFQGLISIYDIKVI